MRPLRLSLRQFVSIALFLAAILSLNATMLRAQAPPRLLEAVDNTRRVTLNGNTHPLARAEFDHGAADDALPMTRMLLLLSRSDAQEAELQAFMEQQQDKSSTNYHTWLTPAQFGTQYGPADTDVQAVTQWLGSQGFRVEKVYSSKLVIEFSGNAGQVRNAFGAAIRNYEVNGKTYVANANDPQIPAALAPVVAGILSLNNFPKKTLHRNVGVFTRDKQTGKALLLKSENPQLTQQCGSNNSGQPLYCNMLVPYDFATIYNVAPLWSATPAIDGTGETIAIVARSNINVTDVQNFRSSFGLPANDPIIVPNGPDPGLVQGDETEALLDAEWSGGVARGATIKLVVSQSTETTDGVDLSALYIVENDLAPVMSVSFGECELYLGVGENQFFNGLWQQASAQGISVFVAAGDNGAAACDSDVAPPPQAAQNGLQVNGMASTPFNTAVGGTDFNDIFSISPYWSTSNNPTTQQSAVSYVPETTWNDTCTNSVFGDPRIGFSTNPETNCNNSRLLNWVFTGGGGGGQSACISASGQTPSGCQGGYAKPSWQFGAGVPLNGGRAMPDVSLFSGDGFAGNAYAVCEADLSAGPCSSAFVAVGGTSASTASFAGLMALVNQKMQARQGNAGYVLYKLAAKQSASSCNATSASGPAGSCIFNDVTSGTIAMPCTKGTLNCQTSSAADQYGVLSGYNAGAAYDMATGLGSVNAQNLIANWSSVTFFNSSTTLSVNGSSSNPVNLPHGTTVSVSSAVTAGSGASGTPTGLVALMATPNPTPNSAPSQNLGPSLGIRSLTLASGTASASSVVLPGGTYSLIAHYQGDGAFKGSDSSGIPVTVTAENSKALISIPTFDPATGRQTGNIPTSLVYGSPYIARIDVGNAQAALTYPPRPVCTPPACPTGSITWTDTVNGTTAPLDGGSLALNSEGFTEDSTIQLVGGQHVLTAAYPGDNSYKASSATYIVTVTPAVTSMNAQALGSPVEGSTFYANVNGTVQTQSGIAPTGTVTFFDGTTQLGSPVQVIGTAGLNGSAPSFAIYAAALTIATGGPHTLNAQYSGDANYAASSTSTTVNVLHRTTASVALNPTTVNYPGTVTVTAIIDTAVPTSNAALKPTGNLTVYGSVDGTIANPTTTAVADGSGNWEIQVTATVTPSNSEVYFVYYGGDNNYAGNSGSSTLLTVNIPDFTLTPTNGLSVVPTAGQPGSAQFTITPVSQMASTVNLALSPFFVSGYTVTLNPQQVSLANGQAATATITMTPTATVPAAAVRIRKKAAFLPVEPGQWWLLSLATALSALFMLGLPGRRNRYRAAFGLTAVALILFVFGCGGGGGSSGSGVGTTPPPPTVSATSTTLTTSSAKASLNGSLTLTVAVTSASGNPLTGTVAISNFGTPVAGGFPLTNGQIQFQPLGYITSPGVYQLTATYSGDTENQPSSSTALTQVLTGTITVNITGNTGGDVHVIQANLGVQ